MEFAHYNFLHYHYSDRTGTFSRKEISFNRGNQGRIQKIQKEGAEETDDAVLHHSGSICDQTLGLKGYSSPQNNISNTDRL